MADGIQLNSGSGGATVATDDCGAAGHAQLFKLAYSADGVATLVLVDANGLKVQLGTAIPAGNNNIGDVDVASLPAGPSTATAPGTSVTVGTSSTTLVATNPSRKALFLCNDHATNIVYVRLGASAAVVSQGIRLNAAGGNVTIRGDEYTGEVRAIATGASTVVTVSEV